MLTRCPHCTASFRVSDTQLQAAHGKVRCGACMKVFNASEHLLADNLPGSHADSLQTIEGLNDDKEFNELTALAPDNSMENPREVNSAGNASSAETNQDPLEQTVIMPSGPPDLSEPDEFSDSFKQLSREHDLPASLQSNPDFNATAGFNANARLADTANEPLQATHHFAGEPTKKPMKRGIQQDAFREPLKADRRPAREPSFQLDSLRADPPDSKPKLRIESSGRWKKTVFWVLLLTAITAFVISQLAWFQFDTLSRNSHLRPVYQQACKLFGCELPSRFNIEQIRSQNLVVRSHPLVNKALIIDAVIINQASYEQPFPDIALTFSDTDFQVIARKIYTPGEYLSGESKSFDKMPANTPIHIALEILDPGKQAVNYDMGFVLNKAYREAE